MYSAYTPRDCIPLQTNLPIEHPEEPPELVHFHDSAMLVFTDFSRVHPVTITTDRSIEYALQKMKNSGIRLLIVVNKKHHMIGLISAYKILGAKPVRLEEADRVVRSRITVGMLMEPRSHIQLLEFSHLRDAKVGHVVATLHAIKEYYLLVVDEGLISGLFSASQISKQLGREIMDLEEPAHSLAELVREIG